MKNKLTALTITAMLTASAFAQTATTTTTTTVKKSTPVKKVAPVSTHTAVKAQPHTAGHRPANSITTIPVNNNMPASSTTTTTTTSGGGKPTMGGGGSGITTTTTTTTTGSGKPSMGGGGSGTTTTTTTTGGSTTGGGIIGTLTQGDAANGVKQALIKGITNGVNIVSVTNGYFSNPIIKIPLPQEVQVVDQTLRMVGAGDMVDKLVLQLNRAAEQSASAAAPIFVNSITQMNLNDAISIVSNQQPDAATQFLKRTTTEQLVSAFRPKVKGVLDQTMTTQLWNEVMTTYNKVPFVTPVNPDLTDYVTRKALDGLFYTVGQEEAKIRKDPIGTGSDIIGKVFGSVLKK